MPINIIQSPPTVCGTKNPVGHQLSTDPSWATYDDYYVNIQVDWEPDYRSGTFIELITLKTRPGDDNLITVDLAKRLDALLKADPPNPAISGGAICNRLIKRYQVYYHEYKDGALVETKTQGIKYVVRAGFQKRTGQQLFWWILTDKKALTNTPRSREVTVNFPGWMYFAIPVSATSVTLKADIIFDDDTTSTVSLFVLAGVAQWDVVYFPVGFQQTGMHTQAKQVKSYELYLTNTSGGAVISDRHLYSLRRKGSSLDRYFVFENSLGGFDTLHTTGEATYKLNTQKQTARKFLSPFFSRLDQSTEVYEVEGNGRVEQEIGFKSKAEQYWLRDIFMSRWGYRVGDIFPRLTADIDLQLIEIEQADAEIFRDNVFLNNTRFAYREEPTEAL